jgi:hypothetical protein
MVLATRGFWQLRRLCTGARRNEKSASGWIYKAHSGWAKYALHLGGNMLSEWLNYERRNPPHYKFDVVDITEKTTPPSEQTVGCLSRELLEAIGSPKMIRAELEILMEDDAEIGLDVVKEYLEKDVLPDIDRVSTRVGIFGEVFASAVLKEFEGFNFPIHKLRFREKKNWDMRLTDLFCIIKRDDVRPLVCYGEVKTKSEGCKLNLAVEAHSSLLKDDALANPEVLHFICTLLYEMGMKDDAEYISRIRLGKLSYDKRHDLFLIHDQANWREEILKRLDGIELDAMLVDFSVKVILINELRNLIERVYGRSSVEARELLDG